WLCADRQTDRQTELLNYIIQPQTRRYAAGLRLALRGTLDSNHVLTNMIPTVMLTHYKLKNISEKQLTIHQEAGERHTQLMRHVEVSCLFHPVSVVGIMSYQSSSSCNFHKGNTLLTLH